MQNRTCYVRPLQMKCVANVAVAEVVRLQRSINAEKPNSYESGYSSYTSTLPGRKLMNENIPDTLDIVGAHSVTIGTPGSSGICNGD
ncbi:MAG: hypothetical protein COA78_24905 [Blastopirellula sp.]|nr:MAG: hypothetical protein COA78_24905 [Blastopirellula sp.]